MGAGYQGAGRYLPTCIQAAATNVPTGIVVGFKPTPDTQNISYRLANTLREVLVIDSADIAFEMQSDGIGLSTDVGKYADIAVGAGSTLFGNSGMYINHSTIGSGTTLRIDGISYVSDSNDLGVYTKFICSFVKHQKAIGTVASPLS
jgi:hypothetical protein